MRHIRKHGQGPRAVQKAHANPPATTDQASSRWNKFSYKQELLHQHLLPEQYGLCGYSELDAANTMLGFHIEHVENKSQNPARTFDYNNLIASVFSSKVDEGLAVARRQSIEVFGGHATGKRKAVNLQLFISPLQADCSRFFTYLSNGEIQPSLKIQGTPDEDRARYTIQILNLNSPYLVSLRREWWEHLEELFDEHERKNWSLKHLAALDLLPSHQKLSRFFSVTRQFFGPLAEHLLQHQAL
ncbi:MAG: TIGR02646 family protein [Burkholderiaceae bacterium]|nr:TIGR02646 family protein [Burkholderiaceae bacterium]